MRSTSGWKLRLTGDVAPATVLFALAYLLSISSCVDSPAAIDADPPTERAALAEAASPLKQLALVGTVVNHAPAVRVLGIAGMPLGGIAVRFAAPGSRDTAVVTTDARGIARWDGWTAPAQPGVVRIDVRADTLPPIRFEADARVRGFDVDVRIILGDPDAASLAAIKAAELKLESLIFADLPNEMLADQPACRFGGAPPIATLNEEVDDLLVLVRLRPIDGLGGAGATGNPCLIRDAQGQTLVGIVDLDEAEWAILTPTLRRDFVLHEMVHVLGFVPNLLNLTLPSGYSRRCLELPSTGAPNVLIQDTHFSCEFGRAAFDESQGAVYVGARVPLENGATRPLGAGTLNHHWRKTVFGAELMTGWFSSGGVSPFSRVTLGMLEDLGYGVVSVLADDWSVTNPGPMQAISPTLRHIQLVEPPSLHAPTVYRKSRAPRRP